MIFERVDNGLLNGIFPKIEFLVLANTMDDLLPSKLDTVHYNLSRQTLKECVLNLSSDAANYRRRPT